MKKNDIILSEYQENIHKSGRIWYIVVYAFILLMPIGSSIIFNAWPNIKDFITAAIGVVPTFWLVGILEAFMYMPMLGAGGSYLGFITGNMANIKVPVALQAMDQAGVKQGSEEGDCVSTIAIAVSSIVTTVIVIVFAILMVPLTPVFSNPILTPAFANVLPALFGGLMVAYITRDIKIGLPVVGLASILFILIPKLGDIYPVLLPVFVGLSVGLARLLYVKGKLD